MGNREREHRVVLVALICVGAEAIYGRRQALHSIPMLRTSHNPSFELLKSLFAAGMQYLKGGYTDVELAGCSNYCLPSEPVAAPCPSPLCEGLASGSGSSSDVLLAASWQERQSSSKGDQHREQNHFLHSKHRKRFLHAGRFRHSGF